MPQSRRRQTKLSDVLCPSAERRHSMLITQKHACFTTTTPVYWCLLWYTSCWWLETSTKKTWPLRWKKTPVYLSVAVSSQVWTARCYREMLRRGYGYVCPSVTLRYDFHTVRNTSKIISGPNSLRLGLTQHGRSGATWTPTKLGWNKGGVTQEHKETCNISETAQNRTKVPMTD